MDGPEEARLVRVGVLGALGEKISPRLIMDLGGGSMEINLLRQGTVQFSTALPIGTVRLMETFRVTGRMNEAEVETVRLGLIPAVEGHVLARVQAKRADLRVAFPERFIERLVGRSVLGIEANGTQLGYYQDIQEHPEMQMHMVVADKPEGSKEMRASVWGSRLDDGLIHCVRAEWNGEFFDELDAFPAADHDDQVDGMSGAYAMLATNRVLASSVPSSVVRDRAGFPRYSRGVF